MKPCLLFLFPMVLAAQSTTSKSETDINGRRAELTRSGVSREGVRTERLQSINGQTIPLEQAEEKVLSDSSQGKVIERMVKKFDQTGRLSSTEKVLIEEEKLAGGGTNVRETTWRSDINGTLREAERRATETRVSGSATRTQTSVSRPTINGGFEAAELRSKQTEKKGNAEESQETVQRRGSDGRFHEAIRELSTVSRNGDQTTEHRATYEPGMTGQLELAGQSQSLSVKRADGTEVTEVNLYARAADGRIQERGAAQQIKEQQIIQRSKASDGSVVETLSVRRPTIADPALLGNVQKLYETVCKGKCE